MLRLAHLHSYLFPWKLSPYEFYIHPYQVKFPGMDFLLKS